MRRMQRKMGCRSARLARAAMRAYARALMRARARQWWRDCAGAASVDRLLKPAIESRVDLGGVEGVDRLLMSEVSIGKPAIEVDRL
jgi:hypothetical protein